MHLHLEHGVAAIGIGGLETQKGKAQSQHTSLQSRDTAEDGGETEEKRKVHQDTCPATLTSPSHPQLAGDRERGF